MSMTTSNSAVQLLLSKNVNGECWPVEGIIRNGEIPASL